MSNYYAPCFYRIDFVVIPSYIELPCINTIVLRLTRTSRMKSFSSCQTVFSIIRMLLSDLSQRGPARVSLLFRVFSLICGVFKRLNCLNFFSPFSILITDRFLFVQQFLRVLNAYGATLPVSKQLFYQIHVFFRRNSPKPP